MNTFGSCFHYISLIPYFDYPNFDLIQSLIENLIKRPEIWLDNLEKLRNKVDSIIIDGILPETIAGYFNQVLFKLNDL